MQQQQRLRRRQSRPYKQGVAPPKLKVKGRICLKIAAYYRPLLPDPLTYCPLPMPLRHLSSHCLSPTTVLLLVYYYTTTGKGGGWRFHSDVIERRPDGGEREREGKRERLESAQPSPPLEKAIRLPLSWVARRKAKKRFRRRLLLLLRFLTSHHTRPPSPSPSPLSTNVSPSPSLAPWGPEEGGEEDERRAYDSPYTHERRSQGRVCAYMLAILQ